MSQPSLASEVANLQAILQALEARVASGEVPGEGLAEFKSSVDDLRLRLWGMMSAGTANDYRAFQEWFRVRRTREICEGVAAELRAGTLSRRHEELGPLAEAAGDLARAVISASRPKS
ncbi:MAG TPA: hypothetical protein VJ794_10655 [Gemmatimonadales bacterium]|nr:hypothetical protein [Gemmatimonadales bacterium]